jgi:hypothetical protein
MPSRTSFAIGRRRLLTGALASTAIIPLRNSVGFWNAADASEVSSTGRLNRADRDALVYGNYEPSANTTGILPGTILTAYNSTLVDTFTLPSALDSAAIAAGWFSYKGGMALADKIIHGDMRPPSVQTVPIFILNSLCLGGRHKPTSDDGVMNCASSSRTGSAAKVTLVDCEIAPRRPSIGRDGIRGRAFDAYRCDIHNVVDGVGIFATTQQGTVNADVNVKGNWIHNLAYTYPDTLTPSHTDGTHNDCIQHQGGRNVRIRGNSLEATTTSADVTPGSGTNPQNPWLIGQGMATGSALIIQNNTGQGVDNTTIAEQNYFYGGKAHLNVKPNISFIYRNNKHYRKTAQVSGGGGTEPTWGGYWIRFDDHTTEVEGLNRGTNNNKWIDAPYAGNQLVEGSGMGINYNV